MNIKNNIKKLNSGNETLKPIQELKTKKIKIVSLKNILDTQDVAPSLSFLGSTRGKIIPRGVSLVSSNKVKEKFKKNAETNNIKNKNNYRTKISKMDTTKINSVVQDIEYIKWKKLDIDIKKSKIKDFYEQINEENNDNNSDIKIEDKIKTIFDLVDINKFFLKKDLQYDIINKRIENIYIFDEEGEKRGYINNIQKQKNKELKKQKKSIDKRTSNKKAVKKLFK
jgi:hypothetical protein